MSQTREEWISKMRAVNDQLAEATEQVKEADEALKSICDSPDDCPAEASEPEPETPPAPEAA